MGHRKHPHGQYPGVLGTDPGECFPLGPTAVTALGLSVAQVQLLVLLLLLLRLRLVAFGMPASLGASFRLPHQDSLVSKGLVLYFMLHMC